MYIDWIPEYKPVYQTQRENQKPLRQLHHFFAFYGTRSPSKLGLNPWKRSRLCGIFFLGGKFMWSSCVPWLSSGRPWSVLSTVVVPWGSDSGLLSWVSNPFRRLLSWVSNCFSQLAAQVSNPASSSSLSARELPPTIISSSALSKHWSTRFLFFLMIPLELWHLILELKAAFKDRTRGCIGGELVCRRCHPLIGLSHVGQVVSPWTHGKQKSACPHSCNHPHNHVNGLNKSW